MKWQNCSTTFMPSNKPVLARNAKGEAAVIEWCPPSRCRFNPIMLAMLEQAGGDGFWNIRGGGVAPFVPVEWMNVPE